MTILTFCILWHILLGFAATHIAIIAAIHEANDENPFADMSLREFYQSGHKTPIRFWILMLFSIHLGVFGLILVLKNVPDKYFRLW